MRDGRRQTEASGPQGISSSFGVCCWMTRKSQKAFVGDGDAGAVGSRCGS